MTEEEIKALQTELEATKAEVTKLTNIKAEVVTQRDEIKKKAQEYETRLTGYEEVVTKTTAELEAERKKREENAGLHAATLKTSAVRAALEKEGVVAMETALKLIPMTDIALDESFVINTDTVAAVVTKLKETDAVLFGQPGAPKVDAEDVPKPKRASEGEPKAGFAEALKQCKTASEVEALLRKHGKIA